MNTRPRRDARRRTELILRVVWNVIVFFLATLFVASLTLKILKFALLPLVS